jgi:hypothetical protein
VAASEDRDTQNCGDDVIAYYSSRGPRDDNRDSDVYDELKPEVTAPGSHYWGGDASGIVAARYNTTDGAIAKRGTSMAAAHVAGLAALIMQANPGLDAAAVKDIIVRTAEMRGVRGPPSAPTKDPNWNNRWGWGLVDGFGALDFMDLMLPTDLTYPGYPPKPIYMSPDISVWPPPRVGQNSIVKVRVLNKGPSAASNATIRFRAYDFSPTIPAFERIGDGERTLDLLIGVTEVSMVWKPKSSGHRCIQTEIIYAPDTNSSNNTAQRNLEVAASPVSFKVRNTLTEERARIDFVPTFEYDANPPWTVQIAPCYVELAADDPPQDVNVLLIPPPGGAAPGSTQIVHVAAMIGDVLL